jgi:hypothetical protein
MLLITTHDNAGSHARIHSAGINDDSGYRAMARIALVIVAIGIVVFVGATTLLMAM